MTNDNPIYSSSIVSVYNPTPLGMKHPGYNFYNMQDRNSDIKFYEKIQKQLDNKRLWQQKRRMYQALWGKYRQNVQVFTRKDFYYKENSQIRKKNVDYLRFGLNVFKIMLPSKPQMFKLGNSISYNPGRGRPKIIGNFKNNEILPDEYRNATLMCGNVPLRFAGFWTTKKGRDKQNQMSIDRYKNSLQENETQYRELRQIKNSMDYRNNIKLLKEKELEYTQIKNIIDKIYNQNTYYSPKLYVENVSPFKNGGPVYEKGTPLYFQDELRFIGAMIEQNIYNAEYYKMYIRNNELLKHRTKLLKYMKENGWIKVQPGSGSVDPSIKGGILSRYKPSAITKPKERHFYVSSSEHPHLDKYKNNQKESGEKRAKLSELLPGMVDKKVSDKYKILPILLTGGNLNKSQSNYLTIIEPNTKTAYSIFSENGKHLLKTYIAYYNKHK